MAKIFLVEDAFDTRDLIKTVLEMYGHEVEIAETGEDGLNRIQSGNPDVILMDISLPGNLNGLDVVKQLRADSAFDETPILALTAHAMVDDRRRSLEAGCDDHITKPIFDLEEFAQMISAYINEGRKAASQKSKEKTNE